VGVSEVLQKSPAAVADFLKNAVTVMMQFSDAAPLTPALPPRGAGAYCDSVVLPVRGAAGNAGNTEASQPGDAHAAGAAAPKSVCGRGEMKIQTLLVLRREKIRPFHGVLAEMLPQNPRFSTPQ